MNLPGQVDREKVRRIIVESLPAAVAGDPAEVVIFGAGGVLDSLGLVNFLADLEYRISDEFGQEIVLASEQAMSRSRSPFRNVASLTEYIEELLAA